MPKRSPTLRSSALAAGVALALLAACGSEPSPSTTTTSTPRDYTLMVAVGDLVCEADDPVSSGECQHEATADLAERLDPDVVLLLGDLQYDDAELSDFKDEYERTWGRFRDISRPVIGNHEYNTEDAAGYFGYWGQQAHPPGGWYSFDVDEAGWHVVVLNSMCDVVGCHAGSEQEQWLRADLAASPAQCTLAAFHHPQHASGRHGGTGAVTPLVDALEDDAGDLVLAGHDHLYERFPAIDGVRHFVVGTGGRSLYELTDPDPLSEFVDNQHFGVLELRLRGGSYEWRFHAIDGRVLDEGQDSCR